MLQVMDEVILIYEVRFLPLEIANKIWCWQYLKRKAVARIFKMWIHRINRSNKPNLYKIESKYE